MFPRSRSRSRSLLRNATHLRLYSTLPPAPTPAPSASNTPKPARQGKSTTPRVSAREKAEAVSSSLRGITEGIFGNEETFEHIDTKPVIKSPRKFEKLSQFHRDQVIEEIEKRMKQNWKKVPEDAKRMAYYISYGNWGAREGFKDNMFANVAPEDLPFALPSQIKTSTPKPSDVIKRLPEADLWQSSETRREDFKQLTRRLDPVSKVVVYFCVIVTAIALYRDKTVGDDGMPREIPDSPYMLADVKKQEEFDALELKKKLGLEAEEKKKVGKKWYYLWLK